MWLVQAIFWNRAARRLPSEGSISHTDPFCSVTNPLAFAFPYSRYEHEFTSSLFWGTRSLPWLCPRCQRWPRASAPLTLSKQDAERGMATLPAARSPSQLAKELLDPQWINHQFCSFWKTKLTSSYLTREAGCSCSCSTHGCKGQEGRWATMPRGREDSKCESCFCIQLLTQNPRPKPHWVFHP